ncbi:MAG: hypothetical protein ABIK83_14030 [Candidatus Zixiibacteriota bacterium]
MSGKKRLNNVPVVKGDKKGFADENNAVEQPDDLKGSDINPNDRVFIRTKSGNRYMLRRSKSAGNAIKIYNERADGFKQGYILYDDGSALARVGKEFEFTVYIAEAKGQSYVSTTVKDIEIRRDIDEACNNSDEIQGWGAYIASKIKKHVSGRREQ